MLNWKIPGWFHRDKEKLPDIRDLILAGIGSFSGIAIAAYLSLNYQLALLVPSFGASAVLLYAASHVPMARTRNVMGGHLVSALAGVTVYRFLGLSWWTLALGVAVAIMAMMITDTLHPPGGATAFAALYTHQNYAFVFKPVAIGVFILLAVAWIIKKYKVSRET